MGMWRGRCELQQFSKVLVIASAFKLARWKPFSCFACPMLLLQFIEVWNACFICLLHTCLLLRHCMKICCLVRSRQHWFINWSTKALLEKQPLLYGRVFPPSRPICTVHSATCHPFTLEILAPTKVRQGTICVKVRSRNGVSEESKAVWSSPAALLCVLLSQGPEQPSDTPCMTSGGIAATTVAISCGRLRERAWDRARAWTAPLELQGCFPPMWNVKARGKMALQAWHLSGVFHRC